MTTKERRHIANQKYNKRIKQRGLVTTAFLMPTAIRPEVKRFIQARSLEYALKQERL